MLIQQQRQQPNRANESTPNVNGNASVSARVPVHVASKVYENSIFAQDLFTIVIKNLFRVQYNVEKRKESNRTEKGM